MPLYEYQCEVCATRFERIQKFSDPPIESCPACQGAVRKLVSSPAIQFKGSGWYITDYAKKGPAAKDDGKPATDGAAKSDSAPAESPARASSSSGESKTSTESSGSKSGSSSSASSVS